MFTVSKKLVAAYLYSMRIQKRYDKLTSHIENHALGMLIKYGSSAETKALQLLPAHHVNFGPASKLVREDQICLQKWSAPGPKVVTFLDLPSQFRSGLMAGTRGEARGDDMEKASDWTNEVYSNMVPWSLHRNGVELRSL